MAFVFAGALAVSFLGLLVRRTRTAPVAAEDFHEPDANGKVDAPLIAGAGLFGIGWGLTGLCPGPALSALSLAGFSSGSLLTFVVAMAAGMVLANLFWKR